MSSPVSNALPHVLTAREIAWFVQEYGFSAGQAQLAGLDGIELHVNHDDMLEWFLSPLTNVREDAYGGSLENRARFVVEVLTAIRDVVGDSMAVGIRLNLKEEVPGGYTAEGGVEIAQYLESTGPYRLHPRRRWHPLGQSKLHPAAFLRRRAMVGPRGEPEARRLLAGGAHRAGQQHLEIAEGIIASGDADVVGMARAHIADAEIREAAEGRTEEIRPCVGGNECINRRYVDGLPFGCAVNPHTAKEVEGPWVRTSLPKRLLVIGGGPAGLELAGLAAESGHTVDLWEAGAALGGQLRIAAAAPKHERFGQYLNWQRNRLQNLGVKIRLNYPATTEDVLAEEADVVAVATGASGRRPPIEGVQSEAVLEIRDILTGKAIAGRRVIIVAQDDHMPPLALADHLSSRGHQVRIVYATNGPAQLLGRYIVGGILGRLSAQQVQFRFMEEVTSITTDTVTTRNVYSGVEESLVDFDSVVLACGGVSESSLFETLRERRENVHILGDAYAPRRLVFATRQAYALAKTL